MRFLTLSLLVCAVACSNFQQQRRTSSDLTLNAAPGSKRIEVQGHRGTRGHFPENSLPAFAHAIEVGADVLELDIGVSKDGELVISHDPFINTDHCLGPNMQAIKDKLPLATLTLAQIQGYVCGLLPLANFPNQKKMRVQYPTLRELFEMVKNSKEPNAKKIGFNIETKLVPGSPEMAPPPNEFAKKIIDLIHEYGFTGRATLQSFDHRTLVESKKIDPNLRISPLVDSTLLNLTLMAKDLKAEIVSPNFMWITKADVDSLHKAGVKVIPWTVNEEKDWVTMINIGVDGIISDYPDELLTFLKSKGLH